MQKLGGRRTAGIGLESTGQPSQVGSIDRILRVRRCVCCLVFAFPRLSFWLVPIQPISWTPSAGVRIIDQRALPDAEIMRDLESAEAVADAIRTMQVRGAPLIGIAAAMGLVAGIRDGRGSPRAVFLDRLGQLMTLLVAARPTAVNLAWALERMRRVAEQTPGDGSALWERLHAEATAIWEEDRAMCRRIGGATMRLQSPRRHLMKPSRPRAGGTGGGGSGATPLDAAPGQGRQGPGLLG